MSLENNRVRVDFTRPDMATRFNTPLLLFVIRTFFNSWLSVVMKDYLTCSSRLVESAS